MQNDFERGRRRTDLEQGGELLLVLDAGARVDEAATVAESAVATDENVAAAGGQAGERRSGRNAAVWGEEDGGEGGKEEGGRARSVPDGLPEHFDAEHVSQDLLRFAVKIRVDECHVIVGGDAVAEGAEALQERNQKLLSGCIQKKRDKTQRTSSTR